MYSCKYNNPVHKIACSDNCRSYALGQTNSGLIIRLKKSETEKDEGKGKAELPMYFII